VQARLKWSEKFMSYLQIIGVTWMLEQEHSVAGCVFSIEEDRAAESENAVV
jgi:hypothetical protein